MSSISTKFISFLLLPLYTYYLSTNEYATIDLISLLQTLLVPVLTLSLFEGVLRFGISRSKDIKKIFTMGFIAAAISCMVVFVCAPFVMSLLGLHGFEYYWIAIYAVTVYMSFFGVFSRTIGKIKLMAFVSAFSSISVIILNVFSVAVLKLGITGYLMSMIIGNGISCVIYIIFGKFYKYFSLAKDMELLKRMLIYSIPMIPNSILWWLNNSVGKFFLTALSSLSVVGLYSVASKIPMMMDTINRVFQQAWSLSAFKEFESDENTVKSFYSNIFNAYSLLMLLISSIIILVSNLIGQLMFSKEFYVAWKLIPWLITGAFFSTLSSFLSSIFMAYQKTNILFMTTGIGAIMNIALNIILIPHFDANGAAIANLISSYIIWCISFCLVSKLIKLDFQFIRASITHAILLIECILICGTYTYSIIGSILLICIMILLNFNQLANLKNVLLKTQGRK